MFATTFSIDLLHQIVVIIIITYLKTWNFVKIYWNDNPDPLSFYVVMWIFYIMFYKLHNGIEHTKCFILKYYEPGKGNLKWQK